MAEGVQEPSPDAPVPRAQRNWDALAAVVASLIGFLALCVSAYTASIQRQQVRAQVWPYLEAGNYDDDRSFVVGNKGVGPAIVRSAQIFIDGKPQPDWEHVLQILGLEPHGFTQSTLNPSVLTPSEQLRAIKFADKEDATDDEKKKQKERWKQFRAGAEKRMTIKICFCSSLDECWMYNDPHPVGYKVYADLVTPVDQCPHIANAEMFIN